MKNYLVIVDCCCTPERETDPLLVIIFSETTVWMLVTTPRLKFGFSNSARRLGAHPTDFLSTSLSGDDLLGMWLLPLLLLLLWAPKSRNKAKKLSLSAPLVKASNDPWLPKSRRFPSLDDTEVIGLLLLLPEFCTEDIQGKKRNISRKLNTILLKDSTTQKKPLYYFSR